MQCPRCQHENRQGRRFCAECGESLAPGCPSCGFSNEPGEKFCGGCGHPLSASEYPATKVMSPESYTPKHLAEKILTSKTALEGERKQVTVLFADLKGSLEFLADRDPEEARKLLDPVLEHMMEAVHRYEGTVNQVMGDGIMALFGAPLAHEDHAVRACYAALRMQESVKRYAEDANAHGVNVQIRVGLNSGEVVVRAIGSDLHMDYTAVGRTTHLAARMEQLARPGSIVLTASTLDLVEGLIAVKPLGPVPVKGLADPVEVYEVTGVGPARTRLQATAQRGLTRFVGREAELKQFHRGQQLAANGHGQILAIVGEAGVGKSRLVHECTHAARLQGWLVTKVAAVSYGKGTSYLPVIDLLKGYFKIQGGDDLREIREKVRSKLLTLDPSLEPTLPALLALLDMPVDDAAWQTLEPGQRRQRTLDAVKGLLLREARDQPLLVIFEDLHWIDGETHALLDGLAEGLGSARLLLLVNYRPEYQHGWGSKTYYGQMRLDALPAEGAGELLDALLGDDPTLRPLKQLLVKRGNPFFLEETVRTLVETKALAGERGQYRLTQSVQVIQVPPTVQAMLAARIDRLSPEDKRLLQIASVVGKDVPFALLQAIVELPDEALRRGLDHLQAVEFVYETRLFPDPEYSFKHALTHEVTYGGLLQERRRGLHARIVDAIETLHRDRLGEHTERLAHHAFLAQLREKAVHYLRQAALKAAARSALPEAQSWFEQALAVLGTLPESPSALEQAFDIHLELRPVLHQLGEIRLALDRLRDAEALAERLNDERRRGRVYAIMTNSHALLGELDEALATGARALAIARTLGDLELRVATTSYLEMVHASRGDHERVVELATENLAALPADWQYKYLENAAHTYLFDRFYLIGTLGVLGRFSQAAGYEAEAIALAEATHRAYLVGWAHLVAGRLHLTQGDWAKARSLLEGGITVMRRGNVGLLLPHTIASSALALAQLGEANEALTRFREGTELTEHRVAKGIVESLGPAYTALGRVALLLGRLDDARRFGERALNHTPAGALILLGEIATHPDRFDPDSAAAHYRRALLSAEPRGMRPNVAQCHLGLGKLFGRAGKREQAQEHLTMAVTMYREMGMQFWLEQAEAELKEYA